MNATDTALAYWVEATGRGALRRSPLPAPGPDDVVVTAAFSGISIGTERLVGRGLVPPECAAAMACAGMQGTFALPISYGYSLVGSIASGPLAGRCVFTMQPHQDRAVVARSRVIALPDAVPQPRATLFPNLETAQNAVWDAEPRAGDRVVVVGGGAVGLLVTFVLAKTCAVDVVLVDADARRREFAARLPWLAAVVAPDEVPRAHFQVAFHTSATSAGLQLAIDAVGFEGCVIELSWYGTTPVTLDLGTSFHHQRKRILASQVATVAPQRRPGGPAARTEAVLDLLQDARLDTLLGAPIPFAQLPEVFARIYRGEMIDPCPVVAYATA